MSCRLPAEVTRIWATTAFTLSWWACAVGVTVIMKAALGGQETMGMATVKFPYPLTLTLLANVCTAALIDLVIVLQGTCCFHRFQARTRSPDLLPHASSSPSCREQLVSTNPVFTLAAMGLMQGLALGAKNEALLMLTVSTRTMVMATNVLVVMLIAGLCGLESFGRTKVCAIFLVAAGGVMQGMSHLMQEGSLQESAKTANDPMGYVLAVVALVLDASRWVLLQAFLKSKQREERPSLMCMPPTMGSPSSDPRAEALLDEKDRTAGFLSRRSGSRGPSLAVSKLRMVSSVMWATCPLALVMSLVFEPEAIPLALQTVVRTTKLVIALAVGVLGINVCEFGVVQWTSAVTFTVLSNLHSIPLVMSGMYFFGEQVFLLEVMGFAICIMGSLLYSQAKAAEAHALP